MNSNIDVFEGNGVKVELTSDKSFVMIMEILTRIGIISRNNKTVWQSCHIYHKKGKYAIFHFKELFLMDGKSANIEKSDYARRNRIAKMLEEWGMIKILPGQFDDNTPMAPANKIRIIPAKEKANYSLIAKYSLGSGNKRRE